MMMITYMSNKDVSRNIMFYILTFIGSCGLLLGLIKGLKKFYKKEKISIKKYLPIVIGIVLLLWCLITCIFSIDINLSIFGDYYRKEGLQTYFFYGGILLLSIMIKNKKLLLKIFNKLLFVEVIIGIIALLDNSITYELMNNQESYTGIFSQFNHYGYYLMFGVITSIFMFFYNKKNIIKLIYLLIYTFLLQMLVLNDTFGCFLSIFITLFLITIYYIFIKKKIKNLIPILGIFILVCATTTRYNYNIVQKNFNRFFGDVALVNDTIKESKKEKDKKKKDEILNKINSVGTTRGTLWKYGIKYIGERPIVGYGIESTKPLYFKDKVDQSRPHNILIQFGVFTGIPGIIIYILFIGTILIRNLKKIKVLDDISILSLFIVTCYLMSSMFGNSMFYTSPYFFIFLGIICKNAFYKKELT